MRYPFIKLPVKVETVLFLIREELKMRSHFNRLESVGFSNGLTQPHLHELIADYIKLDISRDEDFDVFDSVLEKGSAKVEHDMENEELMTVVLKVYMRLVRMRAIRARPKE